MYIGIWNFILLIFEHKKTITRMVLKSLEFRF